MVDTTTQLNVHLANREMKASLGLAHDVCIRFMSGVTQKLDFSLVPLAMDAILGTPFVGVHMPLQDHS